MPTHNAYSRARGGLVSSLRVAAQDAKAMAGMLDRQKGGKLFQDVQVELLEQEKATAAAILGRLKALQSKVRRDDWLVLFLAGHGASKPDRRRGDYAPGSFFYVCVNHDPNKEATQLTSQ